MTMRASASRSWPAASMAARSCSGMPSIHSVVSTSRAVRSHSGCGTRNSVSSRVFSASSDSAAASRRRSISMATDRASVSTTSCGRRRLASGTNLSNMARGEAHGLEVARELLAHARPHHLDGDGAPRVAAARARLVHLGDGGGGDGLAEIGEQDVDRAAEGDRHHARRLGLRKGRHAVLQAFEVARCGDADDVGARRQELPELDVGRPEPRQRRRQPRGAGAGARPLDRAGDAQQQARRRRQDVGSTSASAPSRARTKPARRLRARWTMPPITSDLPARMDRDDAARQWRGASPARSRPPRSCARRRRAAGSGGSTRRGSGRTRRRP